MIDPIRLTTLYVGTNGGGVFKSTDGGGSWAYANNGAPAAAIWEMLIVNDQVIAATHGRGIWTVALPQLSGYEPPAATKSPRLSPLQ